MKKNLTIMIVDDSLEDRETYRRYLLKKDSHAYNIIEEECGEDALVTYESIKPDLILLDYLLPDLDGLEFVEQLKAQTDILPPIIMLTGQGSEVIAVEAMKSGIQDYLVKGKLTSEALHYAVNNVLKQHHLHNLLVKNKRQQQLIAEVALRIRQSLNLQDILDTAVREVQTLLDCDRVVVYRFATDMSGDVAAESVKPGWKKSLGTKVIDTCFQELGADKYERGETLTINDVYAVRLSSCHLDLLAEFQVKANAVIPILPTPSPSALDSSRLWGLLIAHYCSSTHQWQEDEIELLDKLAVQLAIAIQQAELLDNLKNELEKRKQAEALIKERAKELEWLNQEFVKMTRLLKQRNQELDEFAYIISHDLKAPLRAIANLASWLSEDLEGQLPEENQHQLELMQSRVHRMGSFINGLLNYSRMGRQKSTKTTVNVTNLLTETLDSLSPPPKFQLEIEPKMPTLTTDAIALQQVFTNLISNAIKYHHRDDGHIKISVRENEEFYEFAVADDGPGIPSKYHQKIFAIFQTLESKDKIESTGIGLSIVKKIVENQGGTISVKSQVGEGTTFYFTWQK